MEISSPLLLSPKTLQKISGKVRRLKSLVTNLYFYTKGKVCDFCNPIWNVYTEKTTHIKCEKWVKEER